MENVSEAKKSEQIFGKSFQVKKMNRIAQIQNERQKCRTEAPRNNAQIGSRIQVRGNYLNQDLPDSYLFRTYVDKKTQFAAQHKLSQGSSRDHKRRAVTILDNRDQSIDESYDLGEIENKFQPSSIFEVIHGQPNEK